MTPPAPLAGAAPEAPAWRDAALAGALFAIDPAGLGGVALRGGPSPARERWLSMARARLADGAPMRRAPLRIEDERLLGGLDLSATLAAGRPVALRGLLAESDGGVVVLPMAERIEAAAAARFAAALDQGEVAVERDGLATRLPARVGLIVLDDGIEPEERPPAALIERLAFRIDLSGLGAADAAAAEADGEGPARVAAARAALAGVAPAEGPVIEALCATAQRLGVESPRAPLLALRAAAAHAALRGRAAITAEDAAIAARLVLAPRATIAPAEAAEASPPDRPAEAPPEPPPPEPPAGAPDPDPAKAEPLDPAAMERIVEAIAAALPEDLLERIKLENAGRARAAAGRGAGAASRAARRGRPAGSRPGALRAGDRLNLVETLRAATPWQRLRGGGLAQGRIAVRREDFRLRRFVQRLESTTIFVVDASGSAAVQRLAEAKGAVELLLAKAYVSRSRVALIAFRGVGAEILLPPTRSLTRARRSLAALPGGGGTPLAAGIEAALRLALAERALERTPLLVFLTDGRANIALGGAPGRAAAEADALDAARRALRAGVAAAYIDTAARPRPDGDRFARAMGAAYAPLPYLDAGGVVAVVDGLQTARR